MKTWLPLACVFLVMVVSLATGFEDYTPRRQQQPRTHQRENSQRVKTREGTEHHPTHHRGHHRRGHRRGSGRQHHRIQTAGAWLPTSEQIANGSRWLTEMVAPWMKGNVNLGSDVSMEWDLSELLGLGGRRTVQWWKGPNVCIHRDEREEDVPSLSTHQFYTTSKCDQTDSTYRCIAEVGLPGKKKTYTMSYECCHGFQRVEGEAGCPRELNLQEVTGTVEEVGAVEFSKVLERVGLNRMLGEANYTIFAPTDEMFKQYEPPMDLNNNIVIVSPETRYLSQQWRQLLMAHIIPDILPASKMMDEQTIKTVNPHAKIRINFYNSPRELMTANCKPVVSPDHPATNGMVHVVDGVLEPVEQTLSELISSKADLSILKTLIGRVGLNQMLKDNGQMTVFAPTNNAFEALNDAMMDKLLLGDTCLTNLIKTHILPNVICSSVVEGRVRTKNVLDRYVNLTRSPDDKIFLDTAQIVIRDVMATNGVLHLIDKVVIPDDALDIMDVVEKAGGTGFLSLVDQAGMNKTLQNLSNFTLFLPTNEALQAMPRDVRDELTRDRTALEKFIKYHVATMPQSCDQLRDNEELGTLESDKKILIKEYYSAPFGLNQRRTAQCAPIIDMDYKSCDAVTHIISQVMMPPKGDVHDTLSQDARFSRLVDLMKEAGLSEEIQLGSHITFLAPTNDALARLSEQTLAELRRDPIRLKSFLKHHIILGQLCCSGVFDSHMLWKQKERLMDGGFIGVSRYQGNVIVDRDSRVTTCDITATNGVVHAIDQVLHSAIEQYVPSRSRDTAFLGMGRRGQGHRGQGRGQTPFSRMEDFQRHLEEVWDTMRDWDWDVDFTWQPFTSGRK